MIDNDWRSRYRAKQERNQEIWRNYHALCPTCEVPTEFEDRQPEEPSVGIWVSTTIASCPSCHQEFSFEDNGSIWAFEDSERCMHIVGSWKGVDAE